MPYKFFDPKGIVEDLYQAQGSEKVHIEIEESSSEAQTVIGRPEEGDQVEEDPKVGINVGGGFGFAPLHINLYGDDIAAGLNPCLFLGVEYELGPVVKLSEWYATAELRI